MSIHYNEIFENLGYKLEENYSYQIKYSKELFGEKCYIEVWISENDTYIKKYTDSNKEVMKMNIDEFEAIHLLLIEKGWL